MVRQQQCNMVNEVQRHTEINQLQATELTGTSFGFVDIFLYCCSCVKIDDAYFFTSKF